MKLRDLIDIVTADGYEEVDIYDADQIKQGRGMLLYARRWDDTDIQKLPDALLDREVVAIYGDLDYTRCMYDILEAPDPVTIIELKGEKDGNKSV